MGQDRHELVAALKRLTSDLGRLPTRDEFREQGGVSEKAYRRLFGSFSALIHAAGFGAADFRHAANQYATKGKQEKVKYTSSKLQGFFVHTLDLKEMFVRAGNPPSLKIIAQPDTHVKYRDHAAVNCLLRFSQFYAPHVWLIMGDFIDAEGISHWPANDLEPRRLVPELLEARDLLTQIAEHSPGVSTRLYLEGNHEDWINQACVQMPGLFDGLDKLGIQVNLKTLLDLDSFGYQLFPVNHIVKIGHAHFTHGLYAGSNHAKKHLDTCKGNIYYGHTHDMFEHNGTSMSGPLEAKSLACLCRLDAKFLKGKPNNWVHGFGIFEFFPDGRYTVFCPKIIDGRMSFMGQVFDGNV
jgi:hypothetical protein